MCQLGSLGPKALIGDIPALLGGVQPASVVAKTPLRVLQCRADRFAAHLEHNARARKGEILFPVRFKGRSRRNAQACTRNAYKGFFIRNDASEGLHLPCMTVG